MQPRAIVLFIAAAVLSSATTVFGGELALGSAQAGPGQTVTIPLTYSPGKGRVAVAVASDIRFNTRALQHPRCEAGSALTGGSKSVKCAEPKRGVLRLAVFGFNTDPMPAGEVARISFDVAANARPGSYGLRQKPSAADAAGKDFLIKRQNGAVRIGQ